MSLTENAIARNGAKETTSVTPKPASFVPVAVLSSDSATALLISLEKNECYKITQVPSAISQVARINSWIDTKYYFQPRTILGKRLLAIRNKAISKGLPLLDADEIISDLSDRRGEITRV